MKIALLHLSDIHLNNRKCINNENIKRIAVTLYSERKVDRVLILISGDIAFSGSSYEYTAAKYLIGTLISEIKKIFQWKSKNKISNTFDISRDDLKTLFSMTPYFYRTSESDKEKLDRVNSIRLTASFVVLEYAKEG